jgi:uncharacterized protein (TIGR02145 family)
MTKESISKRLTELFELHKSGALTKEEFENLKKQALFEGSVANVVEEDSPKFKQTELPDEPVQVQKGSKLLMFALIGIVMIVAVYFVLRTNNGSTAKDQDEQFYKTVKIGKQIWMAENLNISTFKNGDPIPEARTNEEWEKAKDEQTPAWCYYDNDPANENKFGKLYNWFALNDPRGFAPKGWHVPSDTEWNTLTNYLGGEEIASDKLKNYDFKALMGGKRMRDCNFGDKNSCGYWWTSTESDKNGAWERQIYFDIEGTNRNTDSKYCGYSVRCVKN